MNETLLTVNLKESEDKSSYVATKFDPVMLNVILSQSSRNWTFLSMIYWASISSGSKEVMSFQFVSKYILWYSTENEVWMMCPCSFHDYCGKWLTTALTCFLNLFLTQISIKFFQLCVIVTATLSPSSALTSILSFLNASYEPRDNGLSVLLKPSIWCFSCAAMLLEPIHWFCTY